MNNNVEKKYNLIINIPGDWSKGYHRKSLVNAFLKHDLVERLFVISIPGDLFHSFLKKRFRLKNAIRSILQTEKVNEKLFIFTPLIFMHYLIGFRIPIIRSINKLMFNWSMKRLLKREKINDRIILSVYRPEFVDFINISNKIKIIYDCYDEYLFNSNDQKIKYLKKEEVRLFKKSSFIFTTSTKLQNKALKYNKNSYFIPNAAEVNIFSKAYNTQIKIPTDISNIPPPRIGYLGVFRNWIDYDLLRYLFKNNSDKSFIFIGNWLEHANNVVNNFRKINNVFFLGRKNIQDVPTYLRYIDVAIIPNKMNSFNQNVLPYKLYEYLAAGKKIVTTFTSDDLKKYYSTYIEIAENYEDFSRKINNLINDKSFDHEKVFNFGKNQSWDNRVDRMFTIIKQKF